MTSIIYLLLSIFITAQFAQFAQFGGTTGVGGKLGSGGGGAGVAQPCGGFQCTDSFPGTTLSTNWTQTTGGGSFATNSGIVFGNTNASNDLFALYNTGTFAADQYSCMFFNTNGTDNFIGPAVRISNSLTVHSAYRSYLNNNLIDIAEILNGTYTGLTSLVTATVGHEYCLSAVGTTLTLTDNGTSVLTVTNSDISSGFAGIGAYHMPASSPVYGGAWRAGNLP